MRWLALVLTLLLPLAVGAEPNLLGRQTLGGLQLKEPSLIEFGPQGEALFLVDDLPDGGSRLVKLGLDGTVATDVRLQEGWLDGFANQGGEAVLLWDYGQKVSRLGLDHSKTRALSLDPPDFHFKAPFKLSARDGSYWAVGYDASVESEGLYRFQIEGDRFLVTDRILFRTLLKDVKARGEVRGVALSPDHDWCLFMVTKGRTASLYSYRFKERQGQFLADGARFGPPALSPNCALWLERTEDGQEHLRYFDGQQVVEASLPPAARVFRWNAFPDQDQFLVTILKGQPVETGHLMSFVPGQNLTPLAIDHPDGPFRCRTGAGGRFAVLSQTEVLFYEFSEGANRR